MRAATLDSREPSSFQSHDPRLQPVAAKVLAGKRLDVSDGDFAISFSPQQLIDKIGRRDIAVACELITAENVHGVEMGLRPQSLATQ